MALQLRQTNPAQFDIYEDSAGALQARHGTDELSAHGDTVVIWTDDDALEVRFTAPSGWTLGGTHEDEDGDPVAWTREGSSCVVRFADATTDPVEVTLEGQAQGSSETKTKKVHVHAKPKGALPDGG